MTFNMLQLLLIICLYSLFHLLYMGQIGRRHISIIPQESFLAILHTNMNPQPNVVPTLRRHKPNYGDIVMSYLVRRFSRKQNVTTKSRTMWNSNLLQYRTMLVKYIERLQLERDNILTMMLKMDLAWTFGRQSYQRVLYSENKYYLEKLKQYDFVKTIELNIKSESLLKVSNDVFEYSSNNCKFINNCSSGTRYPSKDSKVIYGISCKPDIGTLSKKRNLSTFSAFGCFEPGKPVTVSYVHIMRNAFIDRHGDVFVKSLKLVPLRCQPDLKPDQQTPNYLSKVPIFDEVFSIAQFWGDGYYHAIVEEMGRLVPYLTFLQRNKNIVVHVTSRPKFLLTMMTLLGIDGSRIIEGATRARILYFPNGMQCGTPNAFNIQLLRLLLHDALKAHENLTTKHVKNTQRNHRQNVILIKRSSKRTFKLHAEIQDILKKLESKFPVNVKVFLDEDLPPIIGTMELFDNTVMIVGLHGAGLTNMIFSKPGTFIIEGLCYNNENRNVLNQTFPENKGKMLESLNLNLCYRNLAHLLGHHYFGLINTDRHCNYTRAEDLRSIVISYLNKRYLI